MATQKQINYALHLLSEKGFSTDWMNSQFKELGASIRERSGKVESWLEGLNNAQISDIIKKLKP